MTIHLTVDLVALGPALEFAKSVGEYFDSIWAGPVLIKNEGMKAVDAFKRSFQERLVVADMLALNGGGLEAELAFGARADAMTVLGVSANESIEAAVRIATRARKRIIANLSGVANPTQRTRDLVGLGVHELVVEMGEGGVNREELRAITRHNLPVILSGWPTESSLLEAADCGVEQILLGRAIYSAADVVEAAKAFQDMAVRR